MSGISKSMMKLGLICNGNVIRCLSSSFHLLYSTSTSPAINSPFIEFLVNSLGFDKSQSISVSTKLATRRQWGVTKKVGDFNSIDNAVSVVQFFKQLGFQQSQIKRLVVREPRVLIYSVEKSLKPKIMLLKELGVSDTDVFTIVFTNYELLRTRLEGVIDALRTVLDNDDHVVVCLKRRAHLSGFSFLVPNVQLLQNFASVRIESIRKFILRFPGAFLVRTDVLRQVLGKVEPILGISRDSSMFMYGVVILLFHSEKSLEDKFAVFKSYGWTQSQITELCSRHPFSCSSSESMIKKKLDFLMNQLGYTPDYLMTKVPFFTYSVEKRLLPRYRILQILKEKGKANCTLYGASCLTEYVFVKRYVLPFDEEVHEVYAQLTGSTVGSLNVGRAKGQS